VLLCKLGLWEEATVTVIDRADRIVLVDIVVDAVRQEGGLASIQPFDEAFHESPRSQRGNHNMLQRSDHVFTQAPEKAVAGHEAAAMLACPCRHGRTALDSGQRLYDAIGYQRT
jgi:hypothetical protein